MKKIKADLILILAAVSVAVSGIVLFQFFGEKGETVVVTDNGVAVAEYPLSKDLETVIKSENGGENVLVIKNGEAEIISASCPDKICCEHRPVKREGESIICLPNKIVVSVEN